MPELTAERPAHAQPLPPTVPGVQEVRQPAIANHPVEHITTPDEMNKEFGARFQSLLVQNSASGKVPGASERLPVVTPVTAETPALIEIPSELTQVGDDLDDLRNGWLGKPRTAPSYKLNEAEKKRQASIEKQKEAVKQGVKPSRWIRWN